MSRISLKARSRESWFQVFSSADLFPQKNVDASETQFFLFKKNTSQRNVLPYARRSAYFQLTTVSSYNQWQGIFWFL